MIKVLEPNILVNGVVFIYTPLMSLKEVMNEESRMLDTSLYNNNKNQILHE